MVRSRDQFAIPCGSRRVLARDRSLVRRNAGVRAVCHRRSWSAVQGHPSLAFAARDSLAGLPVWRDPGGVWHCLLSQRTARMVATTLGGLLLFYARSFCGEVCGRWRVTQRPKQTTSAKLLVEFSELRGEERHVPSKSCIRFEFSCCSIRKTRQLIYCASVTLPFTKVTLRSLYT